MKKIALLFLLVLLIIVPAKSQIKLGAKGGVNLSGVSDTGIDNLNTENITGFYVGPTLEVMLLGRIGLEGSIFYMQKGIHFEGNESEKTEYIEIPVNLKVALSNGKVIKPYIQAGPYVNLKISGNKNIFVVYDQIESTWKTKSYSAGINLGGGIELFRFLQVGLNYGIGLTDNYKESSGTYSVKNRSWSATVAIYL